MGVSFSDLIKRMHLFGMYFVPWALIHDVVYTLVIIKASHPRKLDITLLAFSKSLPLRCSVFPLESLKRKLHSSVEIRNEENLLWWPFANERQMFL